MRSCGTTKAASTDACSSTAEEEERLKNEEGMEASDLATPVPTSVPCFATCSDETFTNVLSDAADADFLGAELFSAFAAIFAPRENAARSERSVGPNSRGATTVESAGSAAAVTSAGTGTDAVDGESLGIAAAKAGARGVAEVFTGAGRKESTAACGRFGAGATELAAGNPETMGSGATSDERKENGTAASGAVDVMTGESSGEVNAIACGALNAEAKSGAEAVRGARANWRERISAGAKLRLASATITGSAGEAGERLSIGSDAGSASGNAVETAEEVGAAAGNGAALLAARAVGEAIDLATGAATGAGDGVADGAATGVADGGRSVEFFTGAERGGANVGAETPGAWLGIEAGSPAVAGRVEVAVRGITAPGSSLDDSASSDSGESVDDVGVGVSSRFTVAGTGAAGGGTAAANATAISLARGLGAVG